MADNPAGVTYLCIPAPDARRSAAFYGAVFGWAVDASRPEPSFADGTGQVFGRFVSDLLVVGDGGVLPYIYVGSVAETLQKVTANGGEVTRQPYDDGDLTMAAFRDPAGNVIGLWSGVTVGGGAGGGGRGA